MKIIKAILIPFFFLVVILFGCKKDMKDVLFEDVYFNMNLNEFLKNQVHVQFVNANYQKSAVVPAVKITIGGKNADLVYDINGTRDIKIENQLSMIVVSPGQDIPASSPMSFTLRAEAPGFMPMEKEITVKDVDDYTNMVFEMVEIANPPVGIKPQQVGNFSIVNYDATNPVVLSNMEGYIPNFSNKAVKAGTTIDNYFQPISYLTVDQQPGATTNQAQTQEFLLPANAINNTTGTSISQNDVIEVYKKNAQDSSWQYAGDAKVQAGSAGALKVALQLSGPGEIALATSSSSTSSTCSSNLGLYFNRPTNVNTLHYIEVVRGDKPTTVLMSAQNVQIAQGLTFNFTTKLPSNIDVIVNVYEFETSSDKGRIVSTSGKIKSCSYTTTSRLTMSVNPPKVTNNPVVRFELDTYCATSKTVYYHEGRTQYRIAGSTGPYKDFGLAIKANSTRSQTVSALPGQPGYVNTTGYSFLESDRILWDWNYEFLTIVSGPNKKTGKTITKTYTRLKKFLQSNYTATVPPGTTVYPAGYFKFYKEYWFAPQTACSDFGY